MHTFKVVKEPYGWAVRVDPGMSTPFWSRVAAIQQADCLCSAIRSHGEAAEVVIEEIASSGIIARGSVSSNATPGKRMCLRRVQWPVKRSLTTRFAGSTPRLR